MQYSPPAAATVNLRRLCIIRAVVVGLQAAATLVAWHFLHWPLPYTALTGIFVLLMGITIAAWWRSYRAWPVTDAEYSAHLVVDVIGLTAVMYLAGGAGNPFVSYFLVPLSIAAATLPRRHAALIAGLCLAAYSWLLVFYRPLPLLAPFGR